MVTIIFDFDGTIANTLGSFFKILNDLAREFNFKSITKKEINTLRDKKARDILKYLGISIIKLPTLVKKVKLELNKNIKDLKPTILIRPTLLKLKKEGYNLAILTSNSKENVKIFLKKNNLDLFNKNYSESSVFGKHRSIKKFIKLSNLKKDEIIYVGDEVRDIESCKKIGVKIIAVTWGYNSAKILKKSNPDFLINNPNELLKIVQNYILHKNRANYYAKLLNYV